MVMLDRKGSSECFNYIQPCSVSAEISLGSTWTRGSHQPFKTKGFKDVPVPQAWMELPSPQFNSGLIGPRGSCRFMSEQADGEERR